MVIFVRYEGSEYAHRKTANEFFDEADEKMQTMCLSMVRKEIEEHPDKKNLIKDLKAAGSLGCGHESHEHDENNNESWGFF